MSAKKIAAQRMRPIWSCQCKRTGECIFVPSFYWTTVLSKFELLAWANEEPQGALQAHQKPPKGWSWTSLERRCTFLPCNASWPIYPEPFFLSHQAWAIFPDLFILRHLSWAIFPESSFMKYISWAVYPELMSYLSLLSFLRYLSFAIYSILVTHQNHSTMAFYTPIQSSLARVLNFCFKGGAFPASTDTLSSQHLYLESQSF